VSDVRIHYTRLPGRVTLFRQRFVARQRPCTITLMERTPLEAPVTAAGGRIILEPGAPAVWFTFDGAWHDVGRFHLADGTYTGCYANILTPVEYLTPLEWATTDLCLDVFSHAGGGTELLDEDELEAAERQGWVTGDVALRARREAAGLVAAAAAGTWPPGVVAEWPLERALAEVGTDGTPDAPRG
jgi:predicted RNA-binding protein associated with RNAse of E/G family